MSEHNKLSKEEARVVALVFAQNAVDFANTAPMLEKLDNRLRILNKLTQDFRKKPANPRVQEEAENG